MTTTSIYKRLTDAPPKRIEEATRPKYSVTGAPIIGDRLRSMGLRQWCTKSEPDTDCTGNPHLMRGGRMITRLPLTPAERSYNEGLVQHRRALQRIAIELYNHYRRLRVADIGFLMGYSSSAVNAFMYYKAPPGY